MNWEAVGAISEAIGVIAIFVSLVYLAAQIRHSTQQFSRSVEASQLAALERNIESGNRMRELLLLHPDLALLLQKGSKSYISLDSADQFRFDLLLRNIFSSLQGGYIRQRLVAHDPLDFEGIAKIIDDLLVNPGAREWLESNTPDWRPEFREFIEERLKKT